MASQPLIHLLQHLLQELGRVLAPHINNLIHKPSMHQLLTRNPLTHNQRLVRLANAQPLHKSNTRISLRHQTERGKRREQKGMWRRVNEIRMRDERSGQAYSRAVQRGNEDLGMCVESMCDVQIINGEGFEPELALVYAIGVDLRAEGYICAAACRALACASCLSREELELGIE